ncbi:PspC domain-containing protein [Micromonospora sp. WMMA1363]|uniref:PspC domain-containing protein n=1 Tax=Micromonospora sp. WMMA1363 TaxID=3053985 RepID=UPI00259CCB05|nr:PspC domain-containing protein [Micromonospora sp. WMMA1363]MDM4720730.1 PspC domain-containing protein [Micromonospora sp. WMMA1363]
MTTTGIPQPPYKQLRRPVTDRMVAGVASGVGRYFSVDPTLVRVIFAVTGLLTGGLALLAYPIMWFLMPEEPAGAPAWPHPTAAATAQPATHPTAFATNQPATRPTATEPATATRPTTGPTPESRPVPQPPTPPAS